MLRLLRILGIVVCAVFLGLAARSLLDGDLERNQVDVAVFSVSFFLFASLAAFEVSYGIRRQRRHRRKFSGSRSATEPEAEREPAGRPADIYAVPPTQEDWKSRRRSHASGRSRRRRTKKSGMVWLVILRILCVAYSLIYLGILLAALPWDGVKGPGTWTIPAIFMSLFLLSIAATIGAFVTTIWGLVVGFVLMLANLPLGAYGLAQGALLLLVLLGAMPLFFESPHERHSRHRRSGL